MYIYTVLLSEFHFVESVPPKLLLRCRVPPPPSGLLLCCLLGGETECNEDTLSACLSTRSASNASSRLDALIFSLRTGVGTKWPSPSPAKASTMLAASEFPWTKTANAEFNLRSHRRPYYEVRSTVPRRRYKSRLDDDNCADINSTTTANIFVRKSRRNDNSSRRRIRNTTGPLLAIIDGNS